MKIILLVDFLPTTERPCGGLQNYTFRTAQLLHAAGEDVSVMSRTGSQANTNAYSEAQLRSAYWKNKLAKILNAFTFHKFESVLNLLLDAHLYRQACERIPEADVIQSPNYKVMGLFIKRKKVKLIVRASSYYPLWTKEAKQTMEMNLISFLEKRLYQKADRVFAPSRYLASVLEEELKIKVDFLPTPIPDINIAEDNSWYEQNLKRKKYLLYFGTILKRKGLFVLSEAMKLVWAKDPTVLLVLAGPDVIVDGRSNLDRLMRMLAPHKDKVIYASNLNPQRLFPVIRNAWFTVSPSLEDNCPNSMLEAMALGKVVLGTYESGMDEFYLESCKQLLVPKGDANALTEKISWLWNLPKDEIDSFGLACKLFVETNHNPTRCAEDLRNYYRHVLAQN